MEVHPRESLNRHWITGTIVALVVIGGSIAVLAAWHKSQRTPPAAPLQQVFFTTDDGQTWFADDAKKVYPFDRDGKQAYRAYVFKCGPNGKPFTAYVEQLGESARTKVGEMAAAAATQPSNDQLELVIQAGRQVRRPGETEWVDAQSEAGDAITTPTCPEGADTEVIPVFP